MFCGAMSFSLNQSGPWRSEQCGECRVRKMEPAYHLLKLQANVEFLVFNGGSGCREEDLEERTFAGLFKGKLHVFILVVVIEIGAPVVHRKEVVKTNLPVDLVVFLVVNEQKGDLEQLIQGSAVQEDDEKRYDDPQFLHVANISENLPQETECETACCLPGFSEFVNRFPHCKRVDGVVPVNSPISYTR